MHYKLEYCHDKKAAATFFPTVVFSLSASNIARCRCSGYSLALWQEFCVDNSMDVKKSDQHHLIFGLEHSHLFGYWSIVMIKKQLQPFFLQLFFH